jgi:hypothetical protein
MRTLLYQSYCPVNGQRLLRPKLYTYGLWVSMDYVVFVKVPQTFCHASDLQESQVDYSKSKAPTHNEELCVNIRM